MLSNPTKTKYETGLDTMADTGRLEPMGNASAFESLGPGFEPYGVRFSWTDDGIKERQPTGESFLSQPHAFERTKHIPMC